MFVLVISVATVFALSLGATTGRAVLRPAPGPVAGSVATGLVYVTSTTDDFWHLVNPVTFARLGYNRNDIKWYGTGGLPGSVAPDTVPTPASQSFLVKPTWHPVSAPDFQKNGYNWLQVKWYGPLPGTIVP
jgi:hypothetical protein